MSEKPSYEELERRVRELEGALKRAEAILDNLPDHVIVQDLNHRIHFANKAARESLNSDWNGDLERRCHELWASQTHACPDCPMPLSVQSGTWEGTQKSTPDGRTWRVRCRPLPETRGGDTQVLQVTEEIPEDLNIREARRRAEESRKLILDTMQEMLAYHDTQLRVKWANRAAADSVGKEAEELVGRHCYEIWQQRDAPCEGCPVLEAMESGQARESEAVTPDQRVYRIRGYPVYDDEGVLQGAVEYGLDITDSKQAQEALENNEALFRAVFEQAPCAVLLLDAETGRPVEFNEQAHRALGYTREEFRELPVEAVEAEESPEEVALHMKRILEEGEDTFETRHRAKDGRILDVIVNSRTISLFGKPHFLSLWMDFTERRQAEEALEAEHAKLKSLFEFAGEAIVLLDKENNILNANQAFEDVFGYSLEQARGRVIEQLICPERFSEESRMLDEKSLRVKGIKGVELIRKRRDGEEILVSASAGPIKKGDDIIGRFVVFDDITQRKRAEEHLAVMAQMLDEAPGSITVHDTEGRFLYANRKTYELHGYEESEFMALNLHDLDVPESEALLDERFRRIAEDGEASFEVAHFCRDGTTIPLAVLAKSIQWQGRPAVLSIAADITERKRMEEEKERYEEKLRQSQKMEAIGTLAGGIAHDFNNILGIILGNAELAQFDIPEWSPAVEALKEVREATLRARDLVTQILLFARQKEQAITNVRVDSIARDSLKMLRASIPATVEIRQEIESDLPCVAADPVQIQQIIMNLCTNAGQAMEADGGTLAFDLRAVELEKPLDTLTGRLPEGSYIRMRVSDTGPGIAVGNMGHLFEPFFTTKGVGEGTGLGLAVVHGIVQDRGGGIIVESEQGKGTDFAVYLPATAGEKMEDVPVMTPAPSGGTERILFVDDEPMIRRLGQRMLERQGYTVETRASGPEALECFRQDPDHFDLVVTDMTMPGMRGDTLAREIMAVRRDTPVILCTGYSRLISEDKARALGVRAFVMKPLTQRVLADTVRRVLDERPRGLRPHNR